MDIILFFWAILEGAGQLLTVYRLRLYLAVGGSVAGWIILSAGGFLWATLAIPCVSALGGLAWLYRQQKKLLISATAYHPGVLREWNQTVWPLQWRSMQRLFARCSCRQRCDSLATRTGGRRSGWSDCLRVASPPKQRRSDDDAPLASSSAERGSCRCMFWSNLGELTSTNWCAV